MIGVICKWEVLAHPVVTIQCFGWRLFLRTLVAGRNETFLGLVAGMTNHRLAAPKMPEAATKPVAWELRAMRIYEALADRFEAQAPVRQFFLTLAQQEREHADLLELCQAASAGLTWDARKLAGVAEAIPCIEGKMTEIERKAAACDRLAEGMRLVLEIEASEVNDAFAAVLGATSSRFVRAMRAFQTATREHIAFICQEAARLEPSLAPACRELANKYAIAV